jgi:tRNA (adenine37-N6)-methyltransferase
MRRVDSLRQNQRRFSALLALGRKRGNSTISIPMLQFLPELRLQPIGVIETPFPEATGCPIQPSRAGGAKGRVRIKPEFRAGLVDLQGFERIWLVYWLHTAPEPAMTVAPFLDQRQRGIFATRAPARPCPIGISAIRLLSVTDGIIDVAGVDMVNGTPLLDIKPYVPEFDSHPNSRAGWYDESNSDRRLADDRFQRDPFSPGEKDSDVKGE